MEVDLGDRSYPIYIGNGLDWAALLQQHVPGNTCLVVTNTTIAPLYLDKWVPSPLLPLRSSLSLGTPPGLWFLRRVVTSWRMHTYRVRSPITSPMYMLTAASSPPAVEMAGVARVCVRHQWSTGYDARLKAHTARSVC